jgi:hypothetical protein
MPSKSFDEQVRAALARESDAFRPAVRPINGRSFLSQVIAALARVPTVTLPDDPGPSTTGAPSIRRTTSRRSDRTRKPISQDGDEERTNISLQQAAESGHVGAMINLGTLLEEQGDIEGARTWRRRAADAGDTGFISKRDRSPQERGARRTH